MCATWQVWELISSVRSLTQRTRRQFSLRPQVRWRNLGIVAVVLLTVIYRVYDEYDAVEKH